MGMGESGTSTKATKTPNAPEQQVSPVPQSAAAAAAAASYPEWAAAFQAYYSSGCQPPHAYFPSSVASGPPQPHPYMWGAQHMMPPPYGTPAPPPPYGAIYPHGGVFAHPSVPPGSHPYAPYGIPSPGAAAAAMAAPAGAEADGPKAAEAAEDGSPMKRSKGSLGSKGSDAAKGNCSANGALSQSGGESGSEGSSEGSEEDNNNPAAARKRNFEQGGGTLDGVQDYWSGSTRGGVKSSKRSSATSSAIMPSTPAGNASMGSLLGREGAPEPWLQDEREVKRQRRKQSNRESARRSRLRKQAECEELGTRVDTLTVENMALRNELTRLSEECKKLTAENSSLQEKLQKSQGNDREDARQEEEGEDSPLDLHIVRSDGHTSRTGVTVKKSASPRMQAARTHDEGSCDSTGKVTLPLDSENGPEAVAAR